MTASISPSDLSRQLGQVRRPVLLDVRLEEDYALARLPGSKNNCVFEVAFLDRMADVAPDKGATICVYGATADSYEARRSFAALAIPRCSSCGKAWRVGNPPGCRLRAEESRRSPNAPRPMAGSMWTSARATWNGRDETSLTGIAAGSS